LDLIQNHVSFQQAAETFMQNRKLDLSICHENNLHALGELSLEPDFSLP
jgi:hypothetical protein